MEMAVFSPCPPVVVPLSVLVSYKDTSPIGSGPTHATSFYLNDLFNYLQIQSHSEVLEARTSTYDFGE